MPARQATSLSLTSCHAAAHSGLALSPACACPGLCLRCWRCGAALTSAAAASWRAAAAAQQQLDLLVFTDLPSPGRIVLPGLFRTGWLAILQAVRETASVS